MNLTPLSLILVATLLASRSAAQAPYFPPPGDAWEQRAPEQVGLDPRAVKDAVALAVASGAAGPRDLLEDHLGSFGREPHGEAIGPLPQVLREFVMDPIGASHTWRWYGYDNSWIVLDGQLMQSVNGGAHWGGGMYISARDLARFGYLTLRKGKWGDRQVLSEEWFRLATTPGVNPGYGFMNYFLNTGRRVLPSAPEQAVWHLGAGNNIIYVDPVNDLVVVTRWIADLKALDAVIKGLLHGARPPG